MYPCHCPTTKWLVTFGFCDSKIGKDTRWHTGSSPHHCNYLQRPNSCVEGEVNVFVFFSPQPSLCSVHYCLDFCSICQISCSLKPFPAFEVWGSLQGPSSSTHPQMVFRPKSKSMHKLFSLQQHVSVTNPVQPDNVKIAVNAEETYGCGHNLYMKQW